MRLRIIVAALAGALLLTIPAGAQQPPSAPPAPAPSHGGIGGFGAIRVPLVGMILDHRQELGLSPSQVESLGRLGLDAMRDAIRRQADLMIAQVDVDALLDRDPGEMLDLATIEAEIRKAEAIRSDLQIALLRAVEAAKAQLTPEQRAKLAALTAADAATPADPPGDADALSEARGAGHAPSGHGIGGPRGPAPRGPAPHVPSGPRFERHEHFEHGRRGPVVIWPPFWWEPYWAYPLPPVIAQEPPVYIQPSPRAYWYYCASLGAYYPQVASCPEPWVPVPAAGP